MQRRGTDDPSGLGRLSELGVVVAGQPPRAVQPRLVRLRGKPWDPERRQVWWDEAQQRWVGNDVPDFKADSPPEDHMGPFIMNSGGRRPPLRAARRLRRRAVPRTLRADREPGREPAASRPVEQSGGEAVHIVGRQVRDHRRRLQHRLHHLPAHRALSLLDEEQSDERAAHARAVRRDPVELADELGISGGERSK